MVKKTIYLIRHGETAYNKKGAVQGRGINASLNETGQQQATAFYAKYQNISFQKIYLSTLLRTYQTVEGFINQGIPYEQLSGLDEISWGVVEGKTITETGYEVFRDLLSDWKAGYTDSALEGGESPNQVLARQKEAIEKIISHKEESLVLICMHGRAMRILLSYLMEYDLSEMDQFHHSNTCLYILEYDYSTEKFEVKLENNTLHLQEKSQ